MRKEEAVGNGGLGMEGLDGDVFRFTGCSKGALRPALREPGRLSRALSSWLHVAAQGQVWSR